MSDQSWSAAELVGAWEAHRRQFPKVPFYLYEGDFGERGSIRPLDVVRFYQNCSHGDKLHHGDLHFLETLVSHEWRVAKPEDAAILVAPVCIGLDRLLETELRVSRPWCWEHRPTPRILDIVVNHSSLFAERTADHVFVALHWQTLPHHVPGLPDSIWANYETVQHTVKRPLGAPGYVVAPLTAPYDDTLRKRDQRGSPEEGARNITFFFGGNAEARKHHWGYWIRSRFFKAVRNVMSSPRRPANCVWVASVGAFGLPSCDGMDERTVTDTACEGSFGEEAVLRRTQFLLLIRGDTPGTNRLSRAMEYGAIPVFIGGTAFWTAVPFQCFVPFGLFSHVIPTWVFLNHTARELTTAAAFFEGHRGDRARRLMAHFRRDLLWNAPGSRVAENILLEAVRLRRTRRARALADRIHCGFRDRLMRSREPHDRRARAIAKGYWNG